MSEEKVILERNVPLKVILAGQSIWFWITLGYLGIGFLLAWITSISNQIKLTNQRLVWTHGLIAKKDEEIEWVRVRDTSYEVTILGRILGAGSVKIISTDASAPTLIVPFEEPKVWREKIRELIRTEKEHHKIMYTEKV